MNKFVETVRSTRFVMLVIAAVAFVISDGQVSPEEVLQALGGLLGIATGVGTVDYFARKVGK